MTLGRENPGYLAMTKAFAEPPPTNLKTIIIVSLAIFGFVRLVVDVVHVLAL